VKKNIYLCIRNDVMDSLKVGDIVEYGGNAYYLYSIRSGDICTIVRIRDGSIFNEKNGEKRLNASIVNLQIEKIKKI